VNGAGDLSAVDAIDDVYEQLVDGDNQAVRALRNPELVERLEAALTSKPGDAAMDRFANGRATAEDVQLLEEFGVMPPGAFEHQLACLEQLEEVRQEQPEAMLPGEARQHLRLLHNYRGIAAQRATPPAQTPFVVARLAPSLVHRLLGRAPRSGAVRARRQPRDPARPEDEPPLDSAGPR
jgi:hypothetical protein